MTALASVASLADSIETRSVIGRSTARCGGADERGGGRFGVVDVDVLQANDLAEVARERPLYPRCLERAHDHEHLVPAQLACEHFARGRRRLR